jgi:dTDP-4-amino-4,6-dideoxygalactose transaminase
MTQSKKDIPLFKVFMSGESIILTGETLRSGFIGQGPRVEQFEEQLKKHFKHDYVLTVNSATSAEHLALHMLKEPKVNIEGYGVAFAESKWPGIQPGDEILTTPLTCTATNFPILANGFKIKWVDIDPETLNMDLDDLARKITSKTKAIFVVHWGGYPIDLDRLKEIQHQAHVTFGFKPAIIEDCAHAMGSKYKGRLIGTHGNISTFSLQAIKHVTSGDGGILVLPHYDLYRRGKLLRWYGIDRENNRKDFRCEADIPEYGFKFHMNDINASIGIGNFKKMEEIVVNHQRNAAYYDSELKNIPGITLLKRHDDRESAFWIYSLLVERRDDFMEHMKKHGIATSQVHERNDIHSCVREYKTILPNLDKTVRQISSIPVGWWVTKEDREYIVETIKKGW